MIEIDAVSELLQSKRYSQIKEHFKEINPADAAAIIQELYELRDDRESLIILFRLLPKSIAAETFAYLDSDMQKLLIDAFTDKELKDVLDDIFVDDAVDMVEEMPANVVKRILLNTDVETRNAINQILQYPKDSAGSIMTIEYVELKRHMTVEQAFDHIRTTGLDKETIYTCYIKDSDRRLIGIVTVKDLLLADKSEVVEDIMETNIVCVNTHEDREVVAEKFTKYDFLAIPVVDNEERLVGIVTVDDVIDVIREETTEDIEKMAAITPSDRPYLKIGIFETWKQRIPWLLLLMISATFTGKIIGYYEDALMQQAVLTTFIPMLMDTGGNAGGQASVTIIRGLSLGEIEFKDVFKVVWKEIRVAFICGFTLAVVNFVKILIIDRVAIPIAFVVCITVWVTVCFSKLVGCTLPIAAKKVGFDPAVMASPFITTIVDAVSLVIFFRFSMMILGI